DCLEEVLEEDEIILGAQRFVQADDGGALLYRDEHNVGNAEPTDEDGGTSDDPARQANHVEKVADELQNGIGAIRCEVVRCCGSQPAPHAQQAADFVLEFHESDIVFVTLDTNTGTYLPAPARTREKQFSEGLIRNDDRVVVAGCTEERLPFPVDYTHDTVL